MTTPCGHEQTLFLQRHCPLWVLPRRWSCLVLPLHPHDLGSQCTSPCPLLPTYQINEITYPSKSKHFLSYKKYITDYVSVCMLFYFKIGTNTFIFLQFLKRWIFELDSTHFFFQLLVNFGFFNDILQTFNKNSCPLAKKFSSTLFNVHIFRNSHIYSVAPFCRHSPLADRGWASVLALGQTGGSCHNLETAWLYSVC